MLRNWQWVVILMATASISFGQETNPIDNANVSVEDLQRQATKILRAEVGTWKCRWEFLGANGEVVSRAEGTEIFRFAIPDRILEVTTEVPELDNKSISLKFFKPDEKRIYFVSVDKNGDMWTFTETVGGKMAVSKRHPNPDGTDLYLRFKTLRETENERDVLMESSPDQKTWRKIFRQFMVRQPDKGVIEK